MKGVLAAAALAAILFTAAPAQSPAQSPALAPPKPLALALACDSSDCSLLSGPPQTAGLHSGFVRLATGATVGWHTTGAHEEELVILHGKGEAEIEGRSGMSVAEGMIAYIPPQTRHNVKNTGSAPLEYVYVVAPVTTAAAK